MTQTGQVLLCAVILLTCAPLGCTHPTGDQLNLEGRVGSFMWISSPTYKSEGNLELVRLWEEPKKESPKYMAPVRGVYAFLDRGNSIWGIQCAEWTDVKSELRCLMDVDVPMEYFKPPTGGSSPKSDQAQDQIEKRYLGVAAGRMIQGMAESYDKSSGITIPEWPEVQAAPPNDLETFLYWFAGRSPGVERFANDEYHLSAGGDFVIRAIFIQEVLIPLFGFFDMSQITGEGFSATHSYHFGAKTKATIAHLGKNRIRIEARIVFGGGQ